MEITNEFNEMLNIEELGDLKDLVEVLNVELLKNHRIDKDLYTKYDVKRGLRDSNGKGVLTGLLSTIEGAGDSIGLVSR